MAHLPYIDKLLRLRRKAAATRAFTLLEMLVVIFIIAILVSIAAPNLLAQQNKAHDSAALQNVAVGIKNVQFAAIANDNTMPAVGETTDQSSLLGQLAESEPQLSFKQFQSTLPATASSGPEDVSVEILNQGATAKLCALSHSGRTICDSYTASRDADGQAVNTSLPIRSFLDYLYFTDLEVVDPALYASLVTPQQLTLENVGLNPNPAPNNLQRTYPLWGVDACGKYTYQPYEANFGEGPKLRPGQLFRGSGPNAGIKAVGAPKYTTWTQGCLEVPFVTGDVIEGPMHTNDAPLICGAPKFGRNPADRMETSAPSTLGASVPANQQLTMGFRLSTSAGCGTSAPAVNYEFGVQAPVSTQGTWYTGTPAITLPNSTAALKAAATEAYTFVGPAKLVIAAGQLQVLVGTTADGINHSGTTMPYPAGGVVYAKDSGCSTGYSSADPYASRTGCGIISIEGDYSSRSLTVVADSDILITGSLTRSGPANGGATLGLIADDFVRIEHGISTVPGTSCSGASNTPATSTSNITIVAAIAALSHSLVVDNHACGPPLGTLSVTGSIVQKYRGIVGTGSPALTSGYSKSYHYDDRLKTTAPPHFVHPAS